MNFDNKKIFITGATGGLGSQIVLSFAHFNANLLIISGRNEEKLKQLTETFQNINKTTKISFIVADFSKQGEASRVSEEIQKITKDLDIFIQVHGIIGSPRKSVSNLDMNDFMNVMQVNFISVVDMTNEISKFMNKKGSIVFCGSTNGKRAIAKSSQYSSSKAALEMFTKTAAIDLGKKSKIRVNIVLPGWMKTSFSKDLFKTEEDQEQALDKIGKHSTVLGHIATLESVSNMFLFLASDLSKDITGTSNVVDCGELLLGPDQNIQEL